MSRHMTFFSCDVSVCYEDSGIMSEVDGHCVGNLTVRFANEYRFWIMGSLRDQVSLFLCTEVTR
jgi:hypothetical protein